MKPLFYYKGLKVYRRPIESMHMDSTTKVTMGFLVCTVNDNLEDGARIITEYLNAGSKVFEEEES